MISRRQIFPLTAAALALPKTALAFDPLEIVATTGMIADTARQVGGHLVRIKGLMGSGIDPHSYRQTRSDIAALTRADLVLWNGLFLEAQMEEFLLRLGNRQPVVAVAEGLAKEDLLSHADYSGAYDPHTWMDPAMWSDVAAEVAQAIMDVRADIDVSANLTSFQAECATLRSYGEEALAQVPAEKRVLVTAHDAFSYFGRAFGIDVVGVQGISTASEAGLHRIRDLVDMLVERQIEAVFVESSVSDRNMRALIEGAQARGHDVRLGGELFSDAMGADGTYEGTYVGMIDHNITTIARALGASVPENGLNGRLSAGS